ncbi:hypothetical protein CAEBREN_05573 [Caenorhabditis brenneri]|uniref:Uncharacterized protein n=1 Tax=Caenorhabditis brenneri TaxID=135651 RepID=G0NQS7_CAEBE|nr:hypothetical protein CAEBREN_05573 [Caenorhabditis brenneri]
MLSIAKCLLLILIGQPILGQAQLYSGFETVPLSNVNSMYSLLGQFNSTSKALLKFPANNASADYTTDNWMDPCYEEFYSNSDNKYIIYWITNEYVACEAVSYISGRQTPTYPVANLMRVERLGQRCP